MNLIQKKTATRRDVAKYAGVSVATVSYVLGNHPGIKIRPETRVRVQEAARVLNYRPSYIGTALTTRCSFNIGVLFKTLHHLNYRFYREILIGAGSAMEEENYHLLLFFRSSGLRFVESMRAGRADGMFVIQSDEENQPIIELAENRIPMVIVNRPAPEIDPEMAAVVMPDHYEMMRESVEHFIRNGKKKLMMVNLDTCTNQIMNSAFFELCSKHASEQVIGSFLMRPERPAFEEYLRRMIAGGNAPEAMFINRFEYAESACRVFAEEGKIPGKDILIASCDPDVLPAFFPYAMTLYVHDGATIGKVAWDLMKKIFSRTNAPLETHRIPYRKMVFP